MDWSYIAGVFMIVDGFALLIVGGVVVLLIVGMIVYHRTRPHRQEKFISEDRYFLDLMNGLAEILWSVGDC